MSLACASLSREPFDQDRGNDGDEDDPEDLDAAIPSQRDAF